MKHIIVASSNKHKLVEMAAILNPEGIELISPDTKGGMIDVIEDGTTFVENASKKARECAKAWNCTVLADDSGLEVAALNGEPGVYSARYAGEGGNDGRNLRKLLGKLEGVTDRRARFVCAVAVATPEGKVLTAVGTVNGSIATETHGNGGFGYDPAFIPDGYSQTFGELPAEVKNRLSHRSNALHEAVRLKLFDQL